MCALILLVVPATAHSQSQASFDAELAAHVKTMRQSTQVLRFFDRHRWLLRDPRFADEAKRQTARHRARLARAEAKAAALRKARALQEARALRARTLQARANRQAILRRASPRRAICAVFRTYCQQAVQVARCESGLTTTARNGQYRGLFQMGSSERRLFGHGATAIEQVRAAHRYFVRSGRDWSPWSCKPWR